VINKRDIIKCSQCEETFSGGFEYRIHWEKHFNEFMMDNNKNDTNNLNEKVIRVLKTIFDPEIPVDIYELGLIYDVSVNKDNNVKILMTLTSPNCPVAETLPVEVEDKVKLIDKIKDAKVEITFEPPWNKDLISEDAQFALGML
jgi:FeS assembly SUF system protein